MARICFRRNWYKFNRFLGNLSCHKKEKMNPETVVYALAIITSIISVYLLFFKYKD